MNGLEFDWNPNKAKYNLRKHRVTFDEAKTAFDDPYRLIEYDVPHSITEDRWLLIGISNRLRLLSVAYTKRDETTIRIISARRANQSETRNYTA